MKRIAWDARREATEMLIEQMRAEAEKKSKENPILRELDRLVTLKEQQLVMAKTAHESGRVTSRDVAEAEANVAEARIKLLEQQQKQVDPGLSSQISTLNVRLANGMIEMVEARTIQGELEKQLARDNEQLVKKLHGNTENEIAQIRLDFSKRRLTNSFRELDELEAQSSEPVSLKVFPWVD